MYSNGSLVKAVTELKATVNKYESMNSEDVKICISCGNRKIGRVMNVSIAPIITCANCSGCSRFCYDIKAVLQYKNVLDARARNTALVRMDRKRYFAEIEKKISLRKKNKYFRWHVSGDIVDLDYFQNMVRIAAEHPDFLFWTYTKNYFVVNGFCRKFGKDSIPNNLIIMFSEWDGMPLVNPYRFPVFSCKLKEGNKNRTAESFESMYKCPGNCDICKAIHRGCVAGEDTYADEH